MEQDTSTPGGRLRYARKNSPLTKSLGVRAISISGAAERTGINANTIKAHENGRNLFDEAQAKTYARAYGFRWLWLLHNEGPPLASNAAGVAADDEQPINEPLVRLNEVDVFAGAGGGGEAPAAYEQLRDGSWVPSDAVKSQALFPAAWLSELGLDPRQTDLVRVRGDSMWPEIDDGDWVFVDRRVHSIQADDIYLIWDGWGVVAKSLSIVRSSRNEPRVRIISANPKYPPDELPIDDIRVIGRVHFRIGRIIRR